MVTQPDGSVALLAQSVGVPQPSYGPGKVDYSNSASWFTFSPPITFVPRIFTPGTTFEGAFTMRFGGSGDFRGHVLSQGPERFAGSDLSIVHVALRLSQRYPKSLNVVDYSDLAWAPALHLFVSIHFSFVHTLMGQTASPPGVSQRLLSLSPS
jgi:hypothetical protein